MTGLDKSRFEETDQTLGEFTCGICLEIFVNPVVTPCCGQTFCKLCITEWLSDRNTCPNDRRPLNASGLRPVPKAMNNLLSNLKIKCKHHLNGCPSVVRVEEIDKHLKDCPFNACEWCSLRKEKGFSQHNCLQGLKEANKRLTLENTALNERIADLEASVRPKVTVPVFSSHSGTSSAEKFSRLNPRSAVFEPNSGSFGPNNSTHNRLHTYGTRGLSSRPLTSNSNYNSQPICDTFALNSFTPLATPIHQSTRSDPMLEHFMCGDFLLVSKHKTENSKQFWSKIMFKTIISLTKHSSVYTLKRTSSKDTEPVFKQFVFNQWFHWVRGNGKSVRSMFEMTGNSMIETQTDMGKVTTYHYVFNTAANTLTINWTVGAVDKVEVFSRIEY